MKALAKRFLDQEITRRDFATGMTALGFSGAAIQSVLASIASADTTVPREGIEFVGTGGEVLAECLRAAGVEYIFDTNSTGQSPFYDALMTRPEIQMIVDSRRFQCNGRQQSNKRYRRACWDTTGV